MPPPQNKKKKKKKKKEKRKRISPLLRFASVSNHVTDSNARSNTLSAITDFGVHFKVFFCSGTSLVPSSLVPYMSYP